MDGGMFTYFFKSLRTVRMTIDFGVVMMMLVMLARSTNFNARNECVLTTPECWDLQSDHGIYATIGGV